MGRRPVAVCIGAFVFVGILSNLYRIQHGGTSISSNQAETMRKESKLQKLEALLTELQAVRSDASDGDSKEDFVQQERRREELLAHDVMELRGAMGITERSSLPKAKSLGTASKAETAKQQVQSETPWDSSPAAKSRWQCNIPAGCAGAAMRLLCDVRDVFAEHGVKWWLMYGSLLGAQREGGLIKNDDDIDYGVWEDDYKALINQIGGYKALRDSLRKRGLHIPKYGQIHYIKPPPECASPLYMDNWVFRRLPDGVFCQYTECIGGTAQKYEIGHFARLSQVLVEGNPLPAPSDRVPLLEVIYGPSWTQPGNRKGNDGDGCGPGRL